MDCTRLEARLEACSNALVRTWIDARQPPDTAAPYSPARRAGLHDALAAPLTAACRAGGGRFADAPAFNACLDTPDCNAFAACLLPLAGTPTPVPPRRPPAR